MTWRWSFALCWSLACACTVVPPQPPHPQEPPYRSPPPEAPWHRGIVTAHAGIRALESDKLWGPLDTPLAGGLEYCYRLPSRPLGLAVGALVSYDRESTGSSSVRALDLEAYLGPKLYWEPRSVPLQLWAGGGVTLIYAQLVRDNAGVESRGTDTTPGLYAQLGAALRLDPADSIGLEYRLVGATDLSLSGVGGSANYSQIALTFSHAF